MSVCSKCNETSEPGPVKASQCTAVLTFHCPNGHCVKWASSPVLTEHSNNPIYTNNVLFSSSVILSGNNFAKIQLMAKFMNLKTPSESSYYNIQTLAHPIILNFWQDCRSAIIDIFADYTHICICGDGRNDSPGHCAKFCCYVAMEHFTKLIIEFEVLDCRETGGVSVRMEKEGAV